MENLVKKIKKKLVWYNYLEKYKKIMIFGAKDNAHVVYSLVKGAGADIDCFIVSKRADNPSQLDGKLVKQLDEICEMDKKISLIIVSVIYEKYDDIEKLLYGKGFKNIVPSVTQRTLILTNELKEYCVSLLGNMKMVRDFFDCGNYKDIDKVCIYAVTSKRNMHKNIKTYESKYIKYIFAGDGDSVDQVRCEFRDNTGDNISKLNLYFCELTAGYWIYKNDIENDYVGLYHYSRGLDITDKQIESVINAKIDVVLPVPSIDRYGMVSNFTDGFVDVLEALCEISPEYLKSAEKYFSEKMFFCGNMLFSKKRIFCEYYEWMFKILYECEKIRRAKGKVISPRIWGYYGEHLTNIFFLKHIKEYNIAYAEMKFMF